MTDIPEDNNESKVVTLSGDKFENKESEVNPLIVERLEMLLEKAKQGSVQELVYTVRDEDFIFSSGNVGYCTMVTFGYLTDQTLEYREMYKRMEAEIIEEFEE